MDLTASEYLLWRFDGNEDRQALDFRAEDPEMEECTDRSYRIVNGRMERCEPHHPAAIIPDVVVDRRQRGRLGYEYELRWRSSLTLASTTWLSTAQLSALGCLGMARREDERQ